MCVKSWFPQFWTVAFVNMMRSCSIVLPARAKCRICLRSPHHWMGFSVVLSDGKWRELTWATAVTHWDIDKIAKYMFFSVLELRLPGTFFCSRNINRALAETVNFQGNCTIYIHCCNENISTKQLFITQTFVQSSRPYDKMMPGLSLLYWPANHIRRRSSASTGCRDWRCGST